MAIGSLTARVDDLCRRIDEHGQMIGSLAVAHEQVEETAEAAIEVAVDALIESSTDTEEVTEIAAEVAEEVAEEVVEEIAAEEAEETSEPETTPVDENGEVEEIKEEAPTQPRRRPSRSFGRRR
jgi:hypothetical protein